VDATFVFLLQVVEELDDAIAEFLPSSPANEPLSHDQEVELGTLLSAASLVRGSAGRCCGSLHALSVLLIVADNSLRDGEASHDAAAAAVP
jgi:hypothetical protein